MFLFLTATHLRHTLPCPLPPSLAGVYKAWVVINGRMTAVPLRIPRSFYVDATEPPGSALTVGLGPAVKRTLPRGAVPAHTYQVQHGLPVLWLLWLLTPMLQMVQLQALGAFQVPDTQVLLSLISLPLLLLSLSLHLPRAIDLLA